MPQLETSAIQADVCLDELGTGMYGSMKISEVVARTMGHNERRAR